MNRARVVSAVVFLTLAAWLVALAPVEDPPLLVVLAGPPSAFLVGFLAIRLMRAVGGGR